MRFWLSLIAPLLISLALPSEACTRTPPTFTVTHDALIEARAQEGVRLKGTEAPPTIVALRQINSNESVALREIATVSDLRDRRSLWSRIVGAPPEFEDVPAENQILLIPERVLDTDLEYEVTVRDQNTKHTIRIRFKGGMQRC